MHDNEVTFIICDDVFRKSIPPRSVMTYPTHSDLGLSSLGTQNRKLQSGSAIKRGQIESLHPCSYEACDFIMSIVVD